MIEHRFEFFEAMIKHIALFEDKMPNITLLCLAVEQKQNQKDLIRKSCIIHQPPAGLLVKVMKHPTLISFCRKTHNLLIL